MAKRGIETVGRNVENIWSPIDIRTVNQWCEDEVILSERQTQMPGSFSTRMTPYLREPLECFGDVDISDLVLVFGTQTGKTTMIQAGTAWRIVNKPQPIVWVMPTEGLARSFSETRWMPLFDDSSTLQAQKPADRHKFKNLEQHFARCSLVFVGSNSPANLASRPAGLLLMDEVDKFARETDQETSALLLAENRTKSFVGALRVKTSTPTTPDGAIWMEYLKGTQEKFMLECPCCHQRIELLWSQVKWDQESRVGDSWNMARVEASAFYECQRCNGRINDGQKMEMLQGGKWEATNLTAQKGFRSFHLNSLYAPWRSCTFGALAVKFLRDGETINGLQDFTNSTMARPWEQVQSSLTQNSVFKLRGEYLKGTCPIEPHITTIGADVGADLQHWVVTAFLPSGESYVIDYGTVESLEDLIHLGERKYTTPSGKPVTIHGGLADSGWSALSVYKMCKDSRFFHPSKGHASSFGNRISTTLIDEFPGIILYGYGDHALKTELFLDKMKSGKPPVWIPKDSSDSFIRGLSGQQLVPRKTSSGKEFEWRKIEKDHYSDGLKLSHLGWHILKNKIPLPL